MDKKSEISNAAAALGRQGGKSRSDAKRAASRSNGKLGGRPLAVHLWEAELRGMDIGVIVERGGQQIEHLFCSMDEAEERARDDYPGAKIVRHETD